MKTLSLPQRLSAVVAVSALASVSTFAHAVDSPAAPTTHAGTHVGTPADMPTLDARLLTQFCQVPDVTAITAPQSTNRVDDLLALIRAWQAAEPWMASSKQAADWLNAWYQSSIHPLARMQAGFLLAKELIKQDKIDEAQQIRRNLGMATQGWFVGPFANTGGGAIHDKLDAENLPWNPQARFQGLSHESGWQKISIDPRGGVFDLSSYVNVSQEVTGIFVAGIRAEKEGWAVLRLGSSGQAVVSLNGKELHTYDVDRSIALDQNALEVYLYKGVNVLTIRSGNLHTQWHLALRLSDAQGNPLKNIAWIDDPKELAKLTPEKVSKLTPPTSAAAIPVDFVADGIGRLDNDSLSAPVRQEALNTAILLETWLHTTDIRAPVPPILVWQKERARLLDALQAGHHAAAGVVNAPEKTAAQENRENHGAGHIDRRLVADAWVEVAQSRYLRDATERRQALERALFLVPNHAAAAIALAQLKNNQDQNDDARSILRNALIGQSKAYAAGMGNTQDYAKLWRAWIDFSRQDSALPSQNDLQMFQWAQTCPTKETLQSAAALAQQLYAIDKPPQFYWQKLAAFDVMSYQWNQWQQQEALRKNDAKELERLFKQQKNHFPDNVSAYKNYALYLVHQQKAPTKSASSVAEKDKKLSKNTKEQKNLQKNNEATQLLQSLAEKYPERVDIKEAQADVALVMGDREAARQYLQDVLKLQQQNTRVATLLRAMEQDSTQNLAGNTGQNTEKNTGSSATNLIQDAGKALVERYGLDPAQFLGENAAKELPKGAAELGGYVVATTTAARFFEDGLGTIFYDRILRIEDTKRAQLFRALPFFYSDGREDITVLLAEKIDASGRITPAQDIIDRGSDQKEDGMYTDGRAKIVVFDDLKAGDVLHVRVRKDLVGEQNLFGNFFGMLEPIDGIAPQKNWRMVIEAPTTRPLYWGGRGFGEPSITTLQKGTPQERTVYDFVVKDIPRLEPEPMMPPLLDGGRYLSVSTYKNWEDMGSWYSSLVAPQLKLDDELKKIAATIKAKGKTDEERVRLTYEYVIQSTRYVGIELGIHGWKPYPVSEVHRRKFGDCKDKASLLVALLTEMGIDARLALVRTANLGALADGPASMWAFNHAIAYVPALNLFLDGTAEASGMRELPPLDQGATVLIVEPIPAAGSKSKKDPKDKNAEKSRLTTIPIDAADTNLNQSNYTLQLLDDGTLQINGVESFKGSHLAEQRGNFADPATQRDRLERELSIVMPGTQVRSVKVSDLSLSSPEIFYQFDAVVPNRAIKNGDDWTMALSLYPHGLADGYAAKPTRNFGVWLVNPWRTHNVMRYFVPQGYTAELPEGGVVESKHLRFVQKITKTENGFIVDEDTSLLSRMIPVEDYADFRKAALSADAMMKKKVKIKKQK